MKWNEHSNLRGQHAIFSPSQSSWLRYDETKVVERIDSTYRTQLGTEIHDFAASQIILKNRVTSIKNLMTALTTHIYRKYFNEKTNTVNSYGMELIKRAGYLPKDVFENVKTYINDCIGYDMSPEVLLVYSERFFGTTDAIDFRNGYLRIHDLKTGTVAAHMEQLIIYDALFCLEYAIKPGEIGAELRLYQNNDIIVFNPDATDILPVMDKIVAIDKFLDKKEEEL